MIIASSLVVLFLAGTPPPADPARFQARSEIMLERFEEQLSSNGSGEYARVKGQWEAKLSQLRTRSEQEQVAEVQKFFSRFKYRTDKKNYEVLDHYATPFEFMRWGGDCEDFAFAKALALSQLHGQELVRVLYVRERHSGGLHALTLVGDVALDNRFAKPISSKDIGREYELISEFVLHPAPTAQAALGP